MKPEDIFDAITHIRDGQTQLEEPPRKKRRWPWIAAAAALALTAGIFLLNRTPVPLHTGTAQLASARYPEADSRMEDIHYTLFERELGPFGDESASPSPDQDDGSAYYSARRLLKNWDEALPLFQQFCKSSAREFLSAGDPGDALEAVESVQNPNRIYSPLNLYLALSMAAEITEGDTRQQILDLLQSSGMEELRDQTKGLWTLCCQEQDGAYCRAYNSLWLSNRVDYQQPTLDLLAEEHFADSFRGSPGTQEYDQLLQNWVNEHTGGLLEEQAGGLHMDEDMAVTLMSTLEYYSPWSMPFNSEGNTQAVFHSPDGDVKQEFMNSTGTNTYYRGEHFGATAKSLNHPEQMVFILPDEGYSPEDLLAEDSDLWDFLDAVGRETAAPWHEHWENNEWVKLHLSVPKFDVSSNLDLTGGLKALGVTRAFDLEESDFSPLTTRYPVAINKASHACRVMIDEEGCTGASFVELGAFCGSEEKEPRDLYFTLDRPFLFVIYNRYVPLYMGVVNQPYS